MENSETTSKRKSSRKKYIIPVVVLLCILAGYIYHVKTWTPIDSESQNASEAIIRQAAAKELTTDPDNPMDPNELNDLDFAKIEYLGILDKELSDIRMLEKFTNLKGLSLCDIRFPEDKIPLWMSLLGKIGVISKMKVELLDFSILKKFPDLNTLNLRGTQIRNIKFLTDLKKLKSLDLRNTQVCDLTPIKKLTNLKTLNLGYCPDITNEQIEDLQKALPELEISLSH